MFGLQYVMFGLQYVMFGLQYVMFGLQYVMFGLNWSLFDVNYCCQWVCPCFGSNSEDRGRLFCFGAGPRGCVGQRLVWNILKVGHMRRKIRNIRDNKVVNWVDGQQKNLLYFPECFFFLYFSDGGWRTAEELFPHSHSRSGSHPEMAACVPTQSRGQGQIQEENRVISYKL